MVINLGSYSVVNLGDTSFRRKNLIDDYKMLLSLLIKIEEEWQPCNFSQIDFYDLVVTSGLVKESEQDFEEGDKKRKARTYTNAIAKIGLSDKKRRITAVGEAFLRNSLQQDEIEKLFNISNDNVLFLRQLLKLKVTDRVCSVYIFRVAILFLSRYNNVPQNHFAQILFAIKPNYSRDRIVSIISNYQDVVDRKIIFSKFLEQYVIGGTATILSEEPLSDDTFKEIFKNRKTPQSVEKYKEFYEACLSFKNSPTEDKFKKLKTISSDQSIKRAFGFGKIPFEFSGKFDLDEFLSNPKNELLTVANFNESFYSIFLESKRYDLQKEYQDVLIRTFKLSGLISFENALVNLGNRELTSFVFKDLEIVGDLNDEAFIQNLPTIRILDFDAAKVDKLKNELIAKYKVPAGISLNDYFKAASDDEFEKKIATRYSDNELCNILKMFGDIKQHEIIQGKVTQDASIPTIFEYIVAIAWHRLSKKTFNLKDSMNLSLDADGLPLSHAPGGDGDIIAKHNNFDVMLEATLMDKNAQKRGELEPVIRHSANLSIRNNEISKDTYTFFIADELDKNVVNIFRSMAHTRLESSQNRGSFIDGVKIFSIKSIELVELLKNKPDYSKMLNVIFKDYEFSKPQTINETWYNQIWSDINSL